MKKILILILALVFLVGCEGDQGPAGLDGLDGNANVLTGTLAPTNAEWLWSSGYSFQTAEGSWTTYFTRYVEIPVEELTADFLTTGLVLMFFEPMIDSGKWVPLPFSFLAFGLDYYFNVVFETMEDTIRLHYFFTLNTPSSSTPSLSDYVIPTYNFKYVLIEGTALKTMKAVGLDTTDYNSVMAYLNAQ